MDLSQIKQPLDDYELHQLAYNDPDAYEEIIETYNLYAMPYRSRSSFRGKNSFRNRKISRGRSRERNSLAITSRL
jgi:hypothetical protein